MDAVDREGLEDLFSSWFGDALTDPALIELGEWTPVLREIHERAEEPIINLAESLPVHALQGLFCVLLHDAYAEYVKTKLQQAFPHLLSDLETPN